LTEDRTNEEIRERLAIAVPGLVHLLGSNDAGKASAQALFQLARSKMLRASIREAGGVKPLVGLLGAGPRAPVTRFSLLALLNLINGCPANREAVCLQARGAHRLTRLLAQCAQCVEEELVVREVTEPALLLLDRLLVKTDAWVGLVKDAVRKEGGVPALTTLLHARLAEEEPARRWGAHLDALAGALASLVSNHVENRDAVRDSGALAALVHVLQNHPEPARGAAAESAAAALSSVATNGEANKDAVVEAGAVPCLVRLLRCGKAHAVTKNAATAVMVLSYAHAANRHLLRKAGALPELAKLLRAGPEAPVTEKAAWALSNLAQSNGMNQDMIREAGAVARLVGLLEAGGERAVTKAAASALANLVTDNDRNREELVAVGGLAPLVALAAKESCPACRNAMRALRAVGCGSDVYRSAINEALLKSRGHLPQAPRPASPPPLRPSTSSTLVASGGLRSIASALTSVRSSISRKLNPESSRHELPRSCHAAMNHCSSSSSIGSGNPNAETSAGPVAVMECYQFPPSTPTLSGPPSSQSMLGRAPGAQRSRQSSDTAETTLKVHCNSGGKLVKGPAPESPCVYVGGETRMVKIRSGSSYLELISQLGIFCKGPPLVRYALPGEEVMVSLRTDNDVRLMFEEWHLWRRSDQSRNPELASRKMQVYVCDAPAKKEAATTVMGVPVAGQFNPQPAASPAELLKLSGSNLTESNITEKSLYASADSMGFCSFGEEPSFAKASAGTMGTARRGGHRREISWERLMSCEKEAPPPPGRGGASPKQKRRGQTTKSTGVEAEAEAGTRAPACIGEWASASESDEGSLGSSGEWDEILGRRRRRKEEAFSAGAEAESEAAAAALGAGMRTLQPIHPSELEALQRLGAGAYGEVHRARWRGVEVAIKTIWPKLFVEHEGPNLASRLLSAEHVDDFCREAQLISSLQHQNVVQVFGVVQGQRSPAIVTEYMDRSLRHILDRQPRALDQRKRLKLALDAARGMDYLHSRRIVHFDLKSSNTMVGMTGGRGRLHLKVCDFGLAKHKRTTSMHSESNARNSLPWIAPEVMRNVDDVTEKVDVYSFGILLWELWTSKVPYADMDEMAIVGGILFHGLRPPVPTLDQEESLPPPHPMWKDLMTWCWNEDADARPSFPEIVESLETMVSTPY